ncbi:MAG: peptide deformylase [Oscillospiraceae bacterium]|jgi:peptide deformylase|nr:peptide deformylase [Oscillospiraceae bacterium]
MAIRNILDGEDSILYKKSRPVELFDARLGILLDDMTETMRKAEGVGLAAVQVGILRRCCVIDTGRGVVELINPEIVRESGKQEEQEGCLSFPGEYGVTRRPAKVTIRAQDRYGSWRMHQGEGLLARAFCHEIDHMNGIVFKDRVPGRKIYRK